MVVSTSDDILNSLLGRKWEPFLQKTGIKESAVKNRSRCPCTGLCSSLHTEAHLVFQSLECIKYYCAVNVCVSTLEERNVVGRVKRLSALMRK